jgi:hypothetical protein
MQGLQGEKNYLIGAFSTGKTVISGGAGINSRRMTSKSSMNFSSFRVHTLIIQAYRSKGWCVRAGVVTI